MSLFLNVLFIVLLHTDASLTVYQSNPSGGERAMPCLSTRKSCILAVSVLLCAAGLSQLQAQPGGALSGTVLDQTGKAIPGATVEVKNESSGVLRTVTADSDGKFSASDLAEGSYSITVSVPGFALTTRSGGRVTAGATLDISITMSVEKVATEITVNDTISIAAQNAPSGNTLESVSAKTEISAEFIKKFMSPLADYAEVVNYAPGTFSLNPNGIGLGQGKTFFRGFPDGDYTMTFDGIPFEDTNSPTHHSWANFPSGWTDSVDFDRSPGLASTFGPTNFGGSINLQSPQLFPDPDIRATVSYGSWNTRLLQLDADSGFFGKGNRNSFLMDIQQLLSDGYQTYNRQKRVAGYGKYQYRFSDRTSRYPVRRPGRHLDQHSEHHQPDARAGGAVRRQLTCLSGDPGTPTAPNPYYYGYNFYHVQTDFEYAAFTSDLGDGWKFDTKAYTTRYWNKQNYQNGTTVNLTTAKPSGVDKLNGYRHAGDTAILSKESKWGIFRTGVWYDWAYTDRYQIPVQHPDVGRHAARQLPRAFHHAVVPAVCRIRMAPAPETGRHRRHQGRRLQHGAESVPGQRQDSRLPRRNGIHRPGHGRADLHRWRGIHCTHHRLQQLAAEYRGPLLREEQLVGLCPVCRREHHSAEQRIRRAERCTC